MAPAAVVSALFQLTFCLLCFLLCFNTASGIGCFVCSSVNGSEPDCEDTFNNTNKFYVGTCYAGRKERMGLFPATECIKMKAKLYDSDFTVLVRTCVVDNGETNTETEIGRESHCFFVNKIKYNDQYMHGCVLACNTDGCNAAPPAVTTAGITSNCLLMSAGTVVLLASILSGRNTPML